MASKKTPVKVLLFWGSEDTGERRYKVELADGTTKVTRTKPNLPLPLYDWERDDYEGDD